MGNPCFYSLDKILLLHLLSKKLKVNTYCTGLKRCMLNWPYMALFP